MASLRPKKGDVVIRVRRGNDAVFVLIVWGASEELTCSTCGDVLTLAKRTAEPTNAAVWYTDDDVRFTPLLSFR